MQIRMLFLLPVMIIVSCKTQQYAVKVPGCVDEEIRRIQAEAPANPPLEVWLWKVGDENYYYFTAPCCDQYTTLMNDHCDRICAPDGGFTGQGDGNCPPGMDQAEKSLVWKDERQ